LKPVSKETVEALRLHATSNPEDSYAQMAATFAISEISVKRFCVGLGRGKGWRKGRKLASPNADKFWASIDRTSDDCWLWKGCRNSSGYGTVFFDGKSQGAHRVAYTLKHGSIPDGTEIDHLCRNRACCNPAHLEAISHAENMERVRRVQAEKSTKSPSSSPRSIDTAPGIDTRPTHPTEDCNPVVSRFINHTCINTKPAPVTPVSVSVAPRFSEWSTCEPDPVASWQWSRASDIWGQARGSWGRAEDGTTTFKYYIVKIDGVEFRMIARSPFDARLIVEKYWTITRRMSVDEDGKPDADSIDDWLDNWFRYLSPRFDSWKETEPGEKWVEGEEQKRRDERQRRLDKETDWRDKCEESGERRAKFASRKIGASVRKVHRPTAEDIALAEAYELDDYDSD